MRGAKTLHYGQNNINKMNIESKEVEIFASNEKVFGILSDCSNLSLNHIGDKIPNLQEWHRSRSRQDRNKDSGGSAVFQGGICDRLINDTARCECQF